jgi:hypothetical protein
MWLACTRDLQTSTLVRDAKCEKRKLVKRKNDHLKTLKFEKKSFYRKGMKALQT